MAAEQDTEIVSPREPPFRVSNVIKEKLPPKVILVMSSGSQSGIPHASLLLADYSSIGKDVIVFLKSCKKANIHTVFSVSKKDPPFIPAINGYLKEKEFKTIQEVDIPIFLQSNVTLSTNNCELAIMRMAGNAICQHLDAGNNVLVLSDVCQVGRLAVCYSYGWTKCLVDVEDLKEPIRNFVRLGGDKKMFSSALHYEFLKKYKEAQSVFLDEQMRRYKGPNGQQGPKIEKIDLLDVVERGPPPPNTIVLDPQIEVVAQKVRDKAKETGMEHKDVITKYVRKNQNKFVWVGEEEKMAERMNEEMREEMVKRIKEGMQRDM